MTGHVNGSDLLVFMDNNAIGHCTTHTATFSTETKDVAVKPAASVAAGPASLYKDKRITGLSVQVKADGIKFYEKMDAGKKKRRRRTRNDRVPTGFRVGVRGDESQRL